MNNVFQNFAQATVAPGVQQRTARDYQQTVQSTQPTANIQQQQSDVQQSTTQDLLSNGNARITVPQNQSTGTVVPTKIQSSASWLVWVIVGTLAVALILGALRLLRTRPVRTDAVSPPKEAENSVPMPVVEKADYVVELVKEKPATVQGTSVKKKRKSKSKRKKR